MAINSQIEYLQETTYEELGSPAGITSSLIGSWYINNVGKLNNLIDTSYSGVYCSGIAPSLGQDEINIYKLSFMNYYYNKEIKANLGTNGYSWTEIKEGDTVIRRLSPTDIAKNTQILQKENRLELADLVNKYRANRATPRSVASQSGIW